MHALNVVLRVHDLCKLIYNSTFFFKLLPQLFQNIQACLFNIDLKTKLRTRTWQKDCFNEHKLLWNHLHVFEQVLLTDQPFTAFIFSSWLFITIGNMPSCQSHWNIKYYQNTSVVHSPSFYAPEIKDWGWWDIVLALSALLLWTLTLLISFWNFIFWGQRWYIKRHVRNVSARYMGNCSTKYAKGLLNTHFVIEKVGLKVYVKDAMMD